MSIIRQFLKFTSPMSRHSIPSQVLKFTPPRHHSVRSQFASSPIMLRSFSSKTEAIEPEFFLEQFLSTNFCVSYQKMHFGVVRSLLNGMMSNIVVPEDVNSNPKFHRSDLVELLTNMPEYLTVLLESDWENPEAPKDISFALYQIAKHSKLFISMKIVKNEEEFALLCLNFYADVRNVFQVLRRKKLVPDGREYKTELFFKVIEDEGWPAPQIIIRHIDGLPYIIGFRWFYKLDGVKLLPMNAPVLIYPPLLYF